jgi:hypothetical protein
MGEVESEEEEIDRQVGSYLQTGVHEGFELHDLGSAKTLPI